MTAWNVHVTAGVGPAVAQAHRGILAGIPQRFREQPQLNHLRGRRWHSSRWPPQAGNDSSVPMACRARC